MEETKQIEKTAIVFDTNFIKSNNKNLDEVIELFRNKGYKVFVPQIVINEIVYRKCRDEYKRYNEIEDFYNKHKLFIKPCEYLYTYEEIEEYIKSTLQERYYQKFSNMVIPYNTTETLFKTTLERAYKKIPPFVESESDRGFKDTLIWLSIIEYFKTVDIDSIVLLTDDKGFGNNYAYLKQEFINNTGKSIEIEKSSFYTDMIKEEQKDNIIQHNHEISEEELDVLREEIYNCVYNICKGIGVYEYAFKQEEYEYNIFTINTHYTEQNIKNMFSNLEKNINIHILQQNINITCILDDTEYVINSNDIPLKKGKNLLNLYKKIEQKYPFFINQFYTAVTNLINNLCYREPDNNSYINTISDDEAPF